MKKHTYFRLLYSSLLICLLFAISACKKEKNPVLNETTDSKFIFSVASLNNSPNNKLASTNPLNNNNNNNSYSITPISSAINIIYGSKEENIAPGIQPNSAINKITKKTASTTIVYPYMRYRILLYNITTNILEKNIETDASRNLEIPVTAGDEYRWYAYSYNTAGNVEEPVMENNIPTIRTAADKEFIWASSDGPILASGATIPLSINFEHKVAEVIVEINTQELLGTITDIEVEFAEVDYFNTGKINILTGDISDIIPYTSPLLDETNFTTVGNPQIYQARIYTADPINNIESLQLNINKLSSMHHDNSVKELHTATDPPKQVTFSFNAPQIAKSHVASLNFKYTIPTKKILHVTGDGNNSNLNFSFAAQPGSNTAGQNLPPHSMLKQELNYGALPNSIVSTHGYTHQTVLNSGLKAALEETTKPDIVIMSLFYTMTDADVTALNTYLNHGGVVMMFVDNATGFSAELLAYQKFINAAFDVTNIIMSVSPFYGGGSLFRLDHEGIVNDRIIYGPFGNLSNQFWGTDTHNVLVAENLPIGTATNQATVYCNPQPDNVTQFAPTGQVMFKHNSKKLFYIGNSSFLSTRPDLIYGGWAGGDNPIKVPFATVFLPNYPNTADPTRNYNDYPMPRRYGWDAFGVGYTPNSMVYNAPLFANLMAWAIYQAEISGINKDRITENWQEEGKDNSYIWE
ncbi:hypothetical protein [Sphingobacterium rhinopitheci]|uniref:hypothetical protein n=1 Tax=Sphingobacterium rhinopitheci TaxID=2781960 RepID=UPI001F52AA45|nr:hypothetical protein [Sphingobacterium rhinopitheci]MCI0922724.1 hypothetical protein [Sphingobacterium rhinopitheci]